MGQCMIPPEMPSFHHGHTVAGLHHERGRAHAHQHQEHREYADLKQKFGFINGVDNVN